MATGQVPFSHEGFEDRTTKAKARSSAECVAYIPDTSDAASEAVETWKNSEGHMKNMLGNFK